MRRAGTGGRASLEPVKMVLLRFISIMASTPDPRVSSSKNREALLLLSTGVWFFYFCERRSPCQKIMHHLFQHVSEITGDEAILLPPPLQTFLSQPLLTHLEQDIAT